MQDPTSPSIIPTTEVDTLVIGSGAAGLAAAVHLRAADRDVLVVTEGLQMGTSINTGSDKQTYYKLSLCGDDADSPHDMAGTYFSGGSMHGDLALVEASQSARAFLHLVELGMPFPRDPFGQFVGYKTDHDPRRRATSIGPYTSREMCRALIRRARQLDIPVRENRVVVELLTSELPSPDCHGRSRRAAGAIVVDEAGQFEIVLAENVVFAVGGPGGLYKTSVYPEVHTGAIGLALLAGAAAQGLPESQYGLASTKFRWNVSGTFMQVVPRFVSTAEDGESEPREFLREYFDDVGRMVSLVFLKGYQWPFDTAKAIGGSSLIDILVYIETVERGRRVFLDFRENPEDFTFASLDAEAHEYLSNSDALLDTPIDRLRCMNPGAIELYADHGIDITREPLEIAVCAQHNNGGLAADHWWESESIARLFPIGEVNGSHGVCRPGGSALNSGQVGAIRAAERIANRPPDSPIDRADVLLAAQMAIARLQHYAAACAGANIFWQPQRDAFQSRMSRAAAHIRSQPVIEEAIAAARAQWRLLESLPNDQAQADPFVDPEELRETLRNRQLCYAHLVYLDAVRSSIEHGVGSRGSAMLLTGGAGEEIHPSLDERWRLVPEETRFREKVMRTTCAGDEIQHEWINRRPIPESDLWFETAWAKFRRGEIYDT